MKRGFRVGLAMLLVVSIFTGCQNTSVSENKQEVSNAANDAFQKASIENTIFSDKTIWNGNDNLYEVSLDGLAGITCPEIYRWNDDLLLIYSQYQVGEETASYRIKRISLESGSVLCETELDSPTYGQVQILQDKLAINDIGDGKCWLLDSDLEIIDEYEFEGGTFCLKQDGKTAYTFSYAGGIHSVELATGKEQALLENVTAVYLLDTNGTMATFSYVDTESLLQGNGILNLETGKIQLLDSMYVYGSLKVAASGTWLGKVDNNETRYVLGHDAGQYQFEAENTMELELEGGSQCVLIAKTAADGEPRLCAYDKNGNLVSACNPTGLQNSLDNTFLWFEEYGAYVFIMADAAGNGHLLFWDITGGAEGEILELADVETEYSYPENMAIDQAYYDRARHLSEKYDVEILIADQCDTEFSDHRAELLLDEATITQALNTIDEAFSRYPDGFFTQLKHGAYKKIEVQVLGTLEKSSSTSEVSYISGGFMSTTSGKLLLALDARECVTDDGINHILEGTIYHEISHLIDRRLEFDSLLREDAVYSEDSWQALNPEGFVYNETYYGKLDHQYTEYFVDTYACSFPTEDRARIMEYAMNGDTSAFTGKEGLINKLAFYSDCIRDSFDTTGWPAETPWEYLLRQIS